MNYNFKICERTRVGSLNSFWLKGTKSRGRNTNCSFKIYLHPNTGNCGEHETNLPKHELNSWGFIPCLCWNKWFWHGVRACVCIPKPWSVSLYLVRFVDFASSINCDELILILQIYLIGFSEQFLTICPCIVTILLHVQTRCGERENPIKMWKQSHMLPYRHDHQNTAATSSLVSFAPFLSAKFKLNHFIEQFNINLYQVGLWFAQ